MAFKLSYMHSILKPCGLPWLYRISYKVPSRPLMVAYPVGIHLLVRWVRRLHEWTFEYKPSKIEKRENEVYDQAFSHGFNAGRDEERRRILDKLYQRLKYDGQITWDEYEAERNNEGG